MSSALDAEIERALLHALLTEWRSHNYTHFQDTLVMPRFELIEHEGHLAQWHRLHRTISFSRTFVRSHSWAVVLEVLKHEMAHQYVHERLHILDETAHGPAFRNVCERLGIDGSASGLPSATVADTEQDKALRRITRLLALAESPNANEAQAAMNAAQKLMLRYNIDALPTGHTFRQLGTPTGRLMEADRWLAAVLTQHFFVSGIWIPAFDVTTGKTGRVLEISGTAANLELAAYVFDFLKGTADRLWKGHKRENGIRGDKDRQRFVSGVMRGFNEKLTEGARESREEGLVWVGDPALRAYSNKRHPRVRHLSYGGNPRTEAGEQGRAAGREIVLHKPISGGTGGGGRLLGG